MSIWAVQINTSRSRFQRSRVFFYAPIGNVQISWVSSPHFYKSERVIVTYIGNDGHLQILEADHAVPAPPAGKPSAGTDPHAGHQMAAPPSKAPGATDPHAGHKPGAMPLGPAGSLAAKAPVTQATDPVCGLKVDPNTAPQATHQGETYHFCSEEHRQLFQQNPAKYLPQKSEGSK